MTQLTHIDPAEEAIYAEYQQLAHELQMPTPSAFIETEVTDFKGNRVSYHRRRSHTWKRNTYNILVGMGCSANLVGTSFGAGFLSLKDTTNNVRYGAWTFPMQDAYAGATISLYGIVVGTNNTAEDFDNYQLVAQIGHGSGGGALWYLGTSQNTVWAGGPAFTFTTTMRRHWQNRSAGTITVREAAIYAKVFDSSNTRYIMLCRDVLSPERAIASGSQLRVDYDIVTTFPE